MLYLKQARYEEATRVATRYLAGLLETQIRHHDWDTGLVMLEHALSKRSPWPADAAQDPGRSGCAVSGPGDPQLGVSCRSRMLHERGTAVAGVPEWFRPREIIAALPPH